MIRLSGLDHLTLRVADLERAVRFYQDVLGCRIENRSDAAGLVQMRAGQSMIDLADVHGKVGRPGGAAPGKAGRNMDHFCLRVESFDEAAILADLETHHIPVDAITTHGGAGGMGRSIYINDPDGNQIELKGPPAAK